MANQAEVKQECAVCGDAGKHIGYQTVKCGRIVCDACAIFPWEDGGACMDCNGVNAKCGTWLEDNRDLIATAPELLEALELILSRAECPEGDPEGMAYIPWHNETLGLARTALAKAKGE